jgi:hypothetical protein
MSLRGKLPGGWSQLGGQSEEEPGASPGQYGLWNSEDGRWHVEYKRLVLEEVRAACVRGALGMGRSGAETAGLILGTRLGYNIRVLGWYQIEVPEKGPISEKRIAAVVESIEHSGHHLRVIGWFYSRVRGGNRPRIEEMLLHSRYFRSGRPLFMVIHPSRQGAIDASLFIWPDDGDVLPTEPLNPPLQIPAPLASQPLQSVAEPQASADNVPPLTLMNAPRRGVGISLWVIAAFLLFAVVGFIYGSAVAGEPISIAHIERAMQTVDPKPLETTSLHLKKLASGWVLEWNAEATSVQEAARGEVTVEAKGEPRSIRLDKGQLGLGILRLQGIPEPKLVTLVLTREGRPNHTESVSIERIEGEAAN